MLFTAITRRKVYKDPFVCWICLDEETDIFKQKKQWYRHSCHCNLQLHKRCYITLVYKSIKDTFVPMQESITGSDVTSEYIKGSLSSFVYHNGFKPLHTLWWSFKQSLTGFLTRILENTLICYLLDDKDRARVRNTFLKWGSQVSVVQITEDSLPEIFKLNPGNMPKCPQCKNDILNSSAMNFIHKPFLFSLYDKVLEYVDYFSFIALSISLLGNPFATLLSLGLWQLRCIFPESQLRYILNLETTRSLDVYLQSFKGISNISGMNKFLIAGLPLYLYSAASGTSSQSFLFFVSQIFWVQCFRYRIQAYKHQGIDLKLLKNSFCRSTLSLSLYTVILCPILNYLLTPNYIMKALMSQRKDEREGKIKLNRYFAKMRETKLSVFAESIMWPLLGKLTGELLYFTYIAVKRYYNLHDTDIIPGFYASSDEYQMLFNLLGMGVVSLSTSIFSKLSWVNRQKRRLETEALVEEMIKEAEY